MCDVGVSFIRQERVYGICQEAVPQNNTRLADKGTIHVLRPMDHLHEGRMSFEEVISQWYNHDDCSRWCSERKPGQSLDERRKK